jgi:hypothetical protein
MIWEEAGFPELIGGPEAEQLKLAMEILDRKAE